MVESLNGLDWLAEEVATTNQRLAVTVAAVGFMLVVLLSAPQLQSRLNERTRPLYSDVVMTIVLVGSFVLSVAVSLGVWGQTGELRRLYDQMDLGGDVVARAVASFVIVVTAYIVVRFVRRLIREFLGSAKAVTDHQREITHRLSQVLIWSTALVIVLGVWVDDLGGLLVGAGFLGIIVGMAARQTLGAILAGFVLMFARPFEIGDWIEIEGREGIVTDISIVNTRIQTFDGEYVMIPNDVVGSSMVTNRSRKGRLRIEVDVGVDYRTNVDRAADLAESAVEGLEEAMAVPSPQVVAKEFGDSAVILGVRFWIDKPSARRRWRARTAAIREIKAAFEDEGIKIPFPQRELSGRAETGGFRLAGDGAREVDGRNARGGETAREGESARADDARESTEPTPEDD